MYQVTQKAELRVSSLIVKVWSNSLTSSQNMFEFILLTDGADLKGTSSESSAIDFVSLNNPTYQTK